MIEIEYIIGDATAPVGTGNKVICHICNDVGGWGAGFVLAISKRWKKAEEAYRAWYAGRSENDFGLGAVQFVEVEPELWVANLVGQRDVRALDGVAPIRYEAVEEGLGRVAAFAREKGASVHMPRIGCGLAGGTWERIEPIIERTISASGIRVVVYDLK